MTLRERAFALALLVSGALVTTGVCLVSVSAGLVVAGLVVGLWAWLVLSE